MRTAAVVLLFLGGLSIAERNRNRDCAALEYWWRNRGSLYGSALGIVTSRAALRATFPVEGPITRGSEIKPAAS